MKIFIIVLIFLWVNVGFKRDYAALQTHLKIEKFNYKRYKTFKAKNKDKDTLGDGSIIAYVESDDIYQEELQLPNSLITINKQYYKDNFKLKSEIKFISEMEIGVGKFYNHSGILIRETDYETSTKFSLEKLNLLLQLNYNVDIYINRNLGIWRYNNPGTVPYYEIHIFNPINMIKILRINGNNGKIILDTIISARKM